MNSLSMTVVFGLLVATCWGSADTLAALITRRIGSATTTLIAQIAGLVLASSVALFLGPSALSPRALMQSMLWSIVLGALAAGAYLSLYKALAHGPLALVSPVVSAQGGVTLLLAWGVLRESIGGWQMGFLMVIFAGVMLVSVQGWDRNKFTLRVMLSPGLTLALVSMLCFGMLAFGLGEAARETNWLLCVVWTRVFSCLMLSAFLHPGPLSVNQQRPYAWYYAASVIVGCLDVGGLLLLSFASVTGKIGVVGMVASAYGVIPLVAGIALLKERPAPHQVAGGALLVLGLIGVAAPQVAWLWPLGILIFLILAAWGNYVAASQARRRPVSRKHVAKESI